MQSFLTRQQQSAELFAVGGYLISAAGGRCENEAAGLALVDEHVDRHGRSTIGECVDISRRGRLPRAMNGRSLMLTGYEL
jgi:hypothetical protein